VKPLVPIIAAVLLGACSSPGSDGGDNATAPINMDEASPEEGPVPAPSDPAAADAASAPTTNMAGPVSAATQKDYLGRWVGVEGMYLEVAAKPNGGVTLDMRWGLDDDMAGKFDGSVTAEGLRFTRKGVAETARRTDGDATGLKWLAGKTDCLMVNPGEGYCREARR